MSKKIDSFIILFNSHNKLFHYIMQSLHKYIIKDLEKDTLKYANELVFLDWIDQTKINWYLLSKNPNAIHLLELNKEKIDWYWLSQNPNAIHLLELNKDKINWNGLSQNPNIFKLKYNV